MAPAMTGSRRSCGSSWCRRASELQAAQQEASEALAAARERQKRFTMLNATFRRKEEALVGRAEEAEGASSQASE